MLEFLRIQYRLGRLTDEQIKAKAPRWITEEQAITIICGQAPAEPERTKA